MATDQFAIVRWGIEVDERHRALHLRYFSLQKPHARAFHAAYLSFFAAVFSTFSVPSLVTTIRDDLNLTDAAITNGAIAGLAGTVAARLVMGTVLELLGPRVGSAATLLLCSTATFGMCLATNAAAYIALRTLMGFSMACFVYCQYWSTVMYSPPVVGLANGLAAGIANSGAGLTHLFCLGMVAAVGAQQPDFVAWRVTLLLPGALQIAVALGVLAFAQDSPDGDYSQLRASGARQRTPLATGVRLAAANYRVWLAAAVYALTFGCELTINNFVQQYFQDEFDLGYTLASVLASLYGICNVAARPLGGVLSDAAAARRGRRGRLWVVSLLTALAGGACMALKPASSSGLGVTIVALVGTAAAGMGASGAVWGLVPFLGSAQALGVTAGIVGAAGPVGAIVLSAAIMKTQASKASGFFYCGLAELCASPLVLAIVFRSRRDRAAQRARQRAQRGMQEERWAGAVAGEPGGWPQGRLELGRSQRQAVEEGEEEEEGCEGIGGEARGSSRNGLITRSPRSDRTAGHPARVLSPAAERGVL